MMNKISKLSPDDPRLTAYALGELDPAEHAAVEAALQHDAEALAAVAQIRAFGGELSSALAKEPAGESAPSAEKKTERLGGDASPNLRQSAGDEAGAARPAVAPYPKQSEDEDETARRRVVSFPYFWVSGLAAACFTLLFVLSQRDGAPQGEALAEAKQSDVAQPATAPSSLVAKAATSSSGTVVQLALDPNTDEARVVSAPPAAAVAPSVDGQPAPQVTQETKAAVVVVDSMTPEAPSGATVAPEADKTVALVTITGRVVNEYSGNPIARAEVTLADGRMALTDANGIYTFEGVPANSVVQLTARFPGMEDTEVAINLSNVGINKQDITLGYGPVVALDEVRVTGVREGLGAAAVMGYTSSVNSRTVTSRDAFADTPSRRQKRKASSVALAAERSGHSHAGARNVPWSAPASWNQSETRGLAPEKGRSEHNTEAYAYSKDNDFLDVAGNPLSTFSVDVDTASYANVRRIINNGGRPPADAVRIEELVNYFPYRYAAPAAKDKAPFAASMEVASAPWNPQHRLVRIGLKGREVAEAQRPPVNLVFLLDVSGSMSAPNKLPLVKESLHMLVNKLKPTDRVAIVVYAGATGLALPSTEVAKKNEILEALDALDAGGSTNGAMGIQLAYDIAKANFVAGGANRVVLCTDGDFNVGVTNQGDLTRLIAEKAKSGVFLTVLGFGMGNYKDDTLEKLADKGNGNYGYVDTSAEAKKLLVEQLGGTLVTIAKDVKLQVEFNPAAVKSYRLIGYENRLLAKEDFNDDTVDAGEIGAGHTVTALYEVVPHGVEVAGSKPAVDALKYQPDGDAKRGKSAVAAEACMARPEMLTLKVRYKAPGGLFSRKLEFPLVDGGAAFAGASEDFKFAAAVAGFGMLLRESPHKGGATWDAVLGWAEDGEGEDQGGYRGEFIALVRKAKENRG